MFTGMTIENLMISVERAEQQARQQQQNPTLEPPQETQSRVQWQEMKGAA